MFLNFPHFKIVIKTVVGDGLPGLLPVWQVSIVWEENIAVPDELIDFFLVLFKI